MTQILSNTQSMNFTNRWIWCQYSQGAGGKMICAMLQLSTRVHPWYTNIRENFEEFVESRIKINPLTHMDNEPHPPYHIKWYSRQLPFTRGDNLTIQQAEELFRKNNQVYEHNYFLTMHWHKPYFPDWFTGRSISIINDKVSLNFLKNRRDALFYTWKDNTVYSKRFLPAHLVHTNFTKPFKDHPPREKIFHSKEKFYKEEFYEDPEVFPLFKKNNDTRVKLNINLSDFWNRSGSDIATKINEAFDLDIDLKKADYLLDSWLKTNSKFL
jgi:hypothetical protein